VAVLAHEGRGEAEALHRLDLGDDAEDGRGEEVHLVVDDEAPFLAPEEAEVGEVRVLVRPPGEDLVGRDRDGLHRLLAARVLADVLGRDPGLVGELVHPLVDRRDISRNYECLAPDGGHRGHAHDGLARAAGEDDDAVARARETAAEEGREGILLVGPEREGPARAPFRKEPDLEGIARHEGSLVADRPAEPEELALHRAALGEPDAEAVGAGREPPLELLVGAELALDAGIGADEEEILDPGRGFRGTFVLNVVSSFGLTASSPLGLNIISSIGPYGAEDELAEARHGVAHDEGQVVGHLVAPVLLEGLEDRVRAEARARRVPEGQGADSVGVEVLGALLERGESAYRGPRLFKSGIVHVEEEGEVALNDEGLAFGHNSPL
jgi:hypothetical protein